MKQHFTLFLFLAKVGLLSGLAASVAQAQAPTVVSRQPARHAPAAPRTGPVTVQFSQAITAASATKLRVYGSQGRGLKPGTVSGGGTATLSFAPTQLFAPGERVSVSIPNTLTNAAGTGTSKQVYEFTAATGGAGKGFFLDTTETVSTASRDQLLGDIDGDGDLDLLTASGLYGMYSYLNDGQGHFAPYFNTVVGQTPSGAALADINQDGYLDLLAGDADNATVAVALNNGTGVFGLAPFAGQYINVGGRPVSIATGDVDGDGDLDFASANNTASTVTIGFNGGPTTTIPYAYAITSVSTVSVGQQPTTVQLADIDNDGDLDLLTSNGAGNSVSVRFNSGFGTFSGTTSVAVGGAPSDLALTDLDGDGDLDLLTTNAADGTVSVRLNGGTGTFSGTTTIALPPGSTPTGLRVGDVDADGDLDVVVAQGTGGQVITLLNSGTGSLAVQYGALELRAVFGSPVTLGVTLGDVDGDGDLDLLTADQQRNRVILGRDGLAPPVAVPTLTAILPGAGPVGTTGIRLAGTSLSSTNAVFFNGISASFVVNSNVQITATVPPGATTGPVSVTTAGGTAASAQSFIVTAGPVPAVLVTGTVPGRNTYVASPTAAIQATFASPIDNSSVAALRVFSSQRRGRQLGAVSGGGTTTLALTPSPAFAAGERVSLSLPAALTSTTGGSVKPQVIEFRTATGGTGEGVYNTVASSVVLGGLSTYGLHGADLDNDGDLDLVGAVGNPVSLVMRLNDGTGVFSPATGLPTLSGEAGEPVPADVDGDGDLDLLVSESFTSYPYTVRLAVLLNNGRGQFTLGTPMVAANSLGLVRVGDLDADGDLDIAYVDNSPALRVALNNGTGIFTVQSAAVNLSSSSYQLRLGDVDNDGDLDAVTISGTNLVTALNNGQAQFTLLPGVSLGSSYSSQLELGDLNRDGLLDVVTANPAYTTPTPLLFWAGLGNGQYALGVAQSPLAADLTGLSLADVNADGNLDAVGFSGGGSAVPTVSVRLGNGTGQLQVPADVVVASTVSARLYGGEVADFDGDGDLDVLYMLTGGVAELRPNLGRPAPTLTALAPATGPVGTRVLLFGTNLSGTQRVTFNGVAAQSIMVLSATQCATVVPAGATTGPVVLTTAGGAATSPGSFTVVTPLPLVSQTPARNAVSAPRAINVSVGFGQAVTAGNLVVRTNLLQGQRTGTASGAGTATRTFDPTLDFAPGERVQVTVPAPAGSNVQPQVFGFTAAAGGPGQGNLRWGGYAPYTNSVAYGDFDEDGAVDLITYETFQNRLRILFNNGQGKFGTRFQTVTASYAQTICVADLNGDAHLDLITAEFLTYKGNQPVNRLMWRAGTGTGTFGASQPIFNLYGTAVGIEAGDINADGTTDLAVLTATADSVAVTLNVGNGVFQRRANVASPRNASMLRLADLDNDGNLDLLLAGIDTQLYRSMGTGTGDFIAAPALTYPEQVRVFEVGDVDGDGNLDVLTGAAYSQSTIRLRRGTGGGNFGAIQNVGSPGYFNVLRLADFDADGDLDLAVAQSSYYTGPQLLLNSGTGTFTAGLTLAPATVTRELAVADFDLDGSLDLVVNGDSVSSARSGLFSYLNRPLPPAITSFTPTSGPTGTVITITGASLGTITTLTIGGVSVPFTIVSPTQITVTTTAGAATGPIVVAGPAGTATSSSPFAVPLPAISGFTPASGAVQRVVTLTGTYLGGTTAVRFNGLVAPGFVVAGGTQLTVLVPAGATTGLIAVTTPSGTATSTTSFVVVPNPVFVSSVPVRHSAGAALGSPLALTYSQPIDAAAAAPKLHLSSNLRGVRSGTVGGGAPLTFAPAAPLLPGEELTLNVLGGVVDQNGNTVLGPGQVLKFQGAAGGTGRGTLLGDPVFTIPSLSRTVLAGDFTGDNAVDLLVFSSPSSRVTTARLYRNNGQGTFTPDPSFGLPYGDYNYLAPVDLDEDGDLDVICTDPVATSPGWIQPMLNNGNGQFQTPSILGIGGWYDLRGLAVGDVTGDGHIDLLIRDSSGLHVYPGTGAGGFNAPLPAVVGSFPVDGLQLADLDNDGDLDALAYGYSSQTSFTGLVTVLFNNGQGLLQPLANPPTYQYGYQNVKLGDFDGDGDVDLLMQSNGLPTLALYANDGAGGFGQLLRYISMPGAGTDGLNVGDVDADGDLDILVGNIGLSVNLLRNSGAGFFAQPIVVPTTQSAPVAMADFDGDGDLDVVSTYITNVYNTNLQLLRNSLPPAVLPLLSHTPATNALNVPRATAISLTFGQALTSASSSAWRVYGSQRQGSRRVTYAGAGTATPSLTLQNPLLPGEQVSVSVPPSLQAASAAAGVPGARARSEVFQFTAAAGGTGTGTFSYSTSAPGLFGYFNGQPTEVAAADFNDDGVPDVLTAGPNGYGGVDMHLWVGSPNHTGGFPTHSSVGAYFLDRVRIAPVDIDNDGDLDAAGIDDYNVVPNSQRSLTIALNNGSGVFNSYRYTNFPNGALAIAFADFDADGDQDLALSRPLGVEIYLNPGNGDFRGTPYVFAHGLSQPAGLAIGDLDNNGGLDLAVADATTGSLRLWLNANDDSAGLSGQTLALAATGLTARDVQIGDLNGDGRLDLAVLGGTSSVAGAIRLYRNTGTTGAAFSLNQTLALADVPVRLALADLDHDGDSDLLATAGSTVYINFNNGNFGFTAPLVPPGVWGTLTTLVMADFDTDGDLDLLTLPTNTTFPGLSLLLNGGTVLAAQPSAGSSTAALHVYPNPVTNASQRVQVQVVGLGAQAASVAVFNSLGQLVYQQEIPAANAGKAALDLPALTPGTYVVRLTAPDWYLSRKLLVE